jgi:hypothetical protein
MVPICPCPAVANHSDAGLVTALKHHETLQSVGRNPLRCPWPKSPKLSFRDPDGRTAVSAARFHVGVADDRIDIDAPDTTLLRADPPVAGKAEVRHAGAPSFCRSVRGKNIPAAGDRELAEVQYQYRSVEYFLM